MKSPYLPPARDDGRIQGSAGEIIDKFEPLVKSTAWRYHGRGAEYDDLVQEGYLALLLLIPKCPNMQWLAWFLMKRLPGYVRAAAARMRRGAEDGGETLLEVIEETHGENDENLERIETEAMLDMFLTEDERALVQMLYKGATHSQAARKLGVSRQRVSARMKQIRKKLKGKLEDMNNAADSHIYNSRNYLLVLDTDINVGHKQRGSITQVGNHGLPE